ncbi:DUF1289 domain-containing protein [Vibrio cincinnatiensis]|uniref:DUF1289 domain-containing protein n=1 Tax=Vibrio cincinnatiensis TaxID=675 RepID=UPI0012AC7DF3|nr:DUF1289 domain-containing protein [Vibrio cincinnatiensis]
MEQLEFFPIPSPCVGICVTDDKGYCQGCMRKRDERFTWLEMTPAQQLHVIRLCRQRYQRKKRINKTENLPNTEVDEPQNELF